MGKKAAQYVSSSSRTPFSVLHQSNPNKAVKTSQPRDKSSTVMSSHLKIQAPSSAISSNTGAVNIQSLINSNLNATDKSKLTPDFLNQTAPIQKSSSAYGTIMHQTQRNSYSSKMASKRNSKSNTNQSNFHSAKAEIKATAASVAKRSIKN